MATSRTSTLSGPMDTFDEEIIQADQDNSAPRVDSDSALNSSSQIDEHSPVSPTGRFTRAADAASDVLSWGPFQRPTGSDFDSPVGRSEQSASWDSDQIWPQKDDGLYGAFQSLNLPSHVAISAVQRQLQHPEVLRRLKQSYDATRRLYDEAVCEYDVVSEMRDDNSDPHLQAFLNRAFLHANNKLARASRDYRTYVDDLTDLDAALLSSPSKEESKSSGISEAEESGSPRPKRNIQSQPVIKHALRSKERKMVRKKDSFEQFIADRLRLENPYPDRTHNSEHTPSHDSFRASKLQSEIHRLQEELGRERAHVDRLCEQKVEYWRVLTESHRMLVRASEDIREFLPKIS